MMGRVDRSRALSSRILVVATGLLLLSLPLLAADPETWPLLVGCTFASSLGLLVMWKRDPLTRGQVLWGALLLRLAFLPLLPGLTDDLYRYIWDGWLQVEGINPYRYKPEDDALASFQSAPIYDRLNSQSYFSVYPPLVQLLFAVGGLFQQLDWTVSYYVLKGLFATAEFGGVVMLSRLASPRNLLLYAWNPLVLIETAGQGHTESLLVPFLVGAVWAVQRNWGRAASIAVAGAGLVKLYPFVLWPFLLRRYGWTALWPGAGLVALLSLPYAAPYTLPHMMASVELFSELFEFNAGPYYLVKYSMRLLTGADWSKVIGPTFQYIYLSFFGFFYVLDWYNDWSFRRSVLMTIGVFLFFSTTVHPWYFLPLLALGILSDRPVWPWFWVGLFSVGTYLFYVDGPYWIWIVLGWGGGTALGVGLYRAELRRLVTATGHLVGDGTDWARRVYEGS
jgi:hypothetical protein